MMLLTIRTKMEEEEAEEEEGGIGRAGRTAASS